MDAQGQLRLQPRGITAIAYSAEQAKKLLAEAELPGPSRSAIHVPGDRYPQAPETVQAVAQFLEPHRREDQGRRWCPGRCIRAEATKNDYAVSVIAWGDGTGEAGYGLLQTLATPDAKRGRGSNNWGGYSNEAVDKALDAATVEFDAKRREAHLPPCRQAGDRRRGPDPALPLPGHLGREEGPEGRCRCSSDRTTAMQVTQVK